MINNNIDEIIAYVSEVNPDALIFRNPDFNDAIIGYYLNDTCLPVLVYSYDKMVECLEAEYNDEERQYLDATEWINYNTLRTLSYMSPNGRPLIIYEMRY